MEVFGEDIRVFLKDGLFQTSWGPHRYTLSDFGFWGDENMFRIEYLIPDDVGQELQKAPIAYVDDLGNIEGQVEIFIGKHSVGYLSTKKSLFSRELLVSWFSILNSFAIKLNNNSYVAFKIPEKSEYWIEISISNGYAKVKKLECQIFTSLYDFVIVDPNFLTILKIQWEEEIDLDSITREIFAKTSKFIDEVLAYDPKLSEVYPIKNLIESRYIPGK